WFFVLAVSAAPQFNGMSLITLLRYAVAGYFTLGLFLYPSKLLPTAARGWVAFLLPVMCIVSSLWAPYPSDAIHKGVLLAMTAVVAIYIAGKMTPRTFFYGYFTAEFACMVLSYLHPVYDGSVLVGIFNQKNMLAMNMFFLYATGFTLALDTAVSLRWRAIGALAMPLAFVLILLSKSATTIAMAGGCTAVLMVQAFVWQPASRVRHVRSFLILLGAMLLAVLLLLVFGIFAIDPKSGLLNLLGKDSTLTGRTWLWDQARGIMKEHPLLGIGASGFWHPERGQADSITKMFFYPTYVPFNFHNSYLENGVQLGYPGMYVSILLSAWGLFNGVLTWIRKQDLFNMVFLILCALVVIRSNTEIDLAVEFGTVIMVQVAGMRRNEKPTPAAQPVVTTRADPPGSQR
ncbi:MAG: O-antigen ligase family protein, partial [Alphaproteobacteria bacterium]